MPYVHEVSFEVCPEKMSELEIGHALERLVGYLKIRLPFEEGFVFADGWYSVDDPALIRVVMRSEWSEWADVERHRGSRLAEERVFEEFDPHVPPEQVSIRTFAEVGSGPLAARR